MNDQQRAAMQMALEALENLFATVKGDCPSLLEEDSGGNAGLYFECEDAITALREALAQPQGEPQTIYIETEKEFFSNGRKIAKELDSIQQNVPQCDPVGYLVYSLDGVNFQDSYCEGAEPVYTAPPSVEAAIEATKEKAAKVCKPFGNTGEVIAAAIRSMK